jgi:hypothetical protein
MRTNGASADSAGADAAGEHHVKQPILGQLPEPIYQRVTSRAATVEGASVRSVDVDRARGGYQTEYGSLNFENREQVSPSGFCAALCQFCAVEFLPKLRHQPRKTYNSL